MSARSGPAAQGGGRQAPGRCEERTRCPGPGQVLRTDPGAVGCLIRRDLNFPAILTLRDQVAAVPGDRRQSIRGAGRPQIPLRVPEPPSRSFSAISSAIGKLYQRPTSTSARPVAEREPRQGALRRGKRLACLLAQSSGGSRTGARDRADEEPERRPAVNVLVAAMLRRSYPQGQHEVGDPRERRRLVVVTASVRAPPRLAPSMAATIRGFAQETGSAAGERDPGPSGLRP